ncbi:YkgJ family cysteine cluster protein [Natronorubrum aibiense]|uniref:YkgJ family cysteine cluster protein n=1 Tax=Natronorubrum aibiense TaxID=348826 RepID=A0A5P9P549_9EURY|nr:YkgJ family cysteine cluster protein [Natronorubrum aibiense]QFU83274.1 YkgJ family cysteine cluster protein [Natronorubrum aibiense]
MHSLEAELETARQLAVDDIADAIESIGFECTRCGACCTGDADDDHTATVFPDEVRTLEERAGDEEYDWRDVARPMPYGLSETDDGDLEGETFEWALQTDGCGDCAFYDETDSVGACAVHEDRPLICRTYPFSVALAGTSQPMGEAVDSVALPAQRDADDEATVRAHKCEGLGREISRDDAEELARALKERAVRELEEAIGVRDNYEPATPESGEVVVHDSEGAKGIDGQPLSEDGRTQ